MSFRDPGWPSPYHLKPKASGALGCRSHKQEEKRRDEEGRVERGWLWLMQWGMALLLGTGGNALCTPLSHIPAP